ncbi:MAG TPA: hypothetical protein PLR96_05925 [Flavobacteriales bacterium]|jgi:hypothetical protein|nr:hypothetical protein [Flavobacteriales bacterium]
MSASIKTLMVTLTLLILPGLAAFSQMGIRYGIQHEKVTKSTTGSTLNMVLGWDFDLNQRMSGGLDLSMDMNWTEDYSLPQYSTNSLAGPSYYYDKVKHFGVQYRSQFHLMDNDGGSIYLGPTIGLRFITQRINYFEEVQGAFSTFPREVNTEEKGMTLPAGLRLGYRGVLEGGYADLYFAVGTNIGSSEPFTDLRFLVEESMPTTTFFQVGVCYGIGW